MHEGKYIENMRELKEVRKYILKGMFWWFCLIVICTFQGMFCRAAEYEGAEYIQITELVADNYSGLKTRKGECEDWIELHNSGDSAVDLGGWYLSDSEDLLTRWQFPQGTVIEPGGWLIVFCDSWQEEQPVGELHANFSLSKEGEYLALTLPDGVSIVQQFYPSYPPQYTDISYGLAEIEEKYILEKDVYWEIPNEIGSTGLKSGAFPLGIVSQSSGFLVKYYEVSREIASVTQAVACAGNPNVWAEGFEMIEGNYSTLNFSEGDSRGRFDKDEIFPGHTSFEEDRNLFVIIAEAQVLIPEAGEWTFGVRSDDGFRLTLVSMDGSERTFTSEYSFNRSEDETLAVFDFPEAGFYQLKLEYYDSSGDALLELYAAQGAQSESSEDFRLVGDTAAGGLSVGGFFGGEINTDLAADMLGINSRVDVIKSFTLHRIPQNEEEVSCRIRFADGFVAKLNGKQFASYNAPEVLEWNSCAEAKRSAEVAQQWMELEIPLGFFVLGENELIITGLNDLSEDEEFILDLELSFNYMENQWRYFTEPTPNAENQGNSYQERVGAVVFSESAGYKNEPFTLELISPSEGSAIHYTLDGTVPTAGSPLYTEPLEINRITCIRAIATREGYLDSVVTTRTWLFPEEVLSQSSETPEGWPDSYEINDHKMEYGMNASLVRQEREEMLLGLQSIDTISIVTDLKNLFDKQTGIYVNPRGDGTDWERPVSIELISSTGEDGFQIEGGLRIRGAYSRSNSNPKHSFRLFFRDRYGGKLIYPLFGAEGAEEFDKVDLRTSQNFSWSFESSDYNTFIRETFSRDSQRDMGVPYTRSRYYHLYINGQYWGLYQTQERSDADYAQTYLGGVSDDWDCIKTNGDGYRTEASDGTIDAFYDFHHIAVEEGFSGIYATNYYWIRGMDEDGNRIEGSPVYLDEDNLINYMLITYFTRDPDCPVAVNSHVNNLYGLYNRVDPSGFKWFKHDGEHSMAANRSYPVTTDLTAHGWQLNSRDQFNPMRLHQKLMEHPDYRMRWIDAVQRELIDEGGALSLSNSLARWNQRQEELDYAIQLEAARWGHGKTKQTWLTECDYVKNSFIALSADYLLPQLRNRGWFPEINAPVFTDLVQTEDQIDVTVIGEGELYYTIDGSDPRLPSGELNPFAIRMIPDALAQEVLISRGSEWFYYDRGNPGRDSNELYYFQKGYNCEDWSRGDARLGFGPRPVQTQVNRYHPQTGEPLVTVYFARSFYIESSLLFSGLVLNLNADDAAVVFINGRRLILQNISTGHSDSTFALSDISGEDENKYQSYELDASCLVDGENWITVEVHQSSDQSDDLYFDLELLAEADENSSGIRSHLTVAPGTNLKIRAWNGVEWSALAEKDFTVYGEYSDFKVTEMMYAAALPTGAEEQGWSRDDYAWLELQNTGAGILNLEGIQFTSGIEYVFPKFYLYPSESIVLVKNIEAFSTLYNTNGMNILTGYSGNLARNGEEIVLSSPQGEPLLSYTYSNKWYPETDRGGYSLVVVDTSAEEPLWSTAENWKPSSNLQGSPCTSDGISGAIAPIIKVQPRNTWVVEREQVLLSVTAGGTPPLSYQWYKNGSLIEGANETQLVIESAVLSDAGEYHVVISNEVDSTESKTAVLKVDLFVPDPPVILQQPSWAMVMPGENASFSVAVTGSNPLIYQWYVNGIPIEGANRSSYFIDNVTVEDSLNFYSVTVSNEAGSVTSESVGLNLINANLLRQGDFIIAVGANNSSYPDNENPPLALDLNPETKYLNFGGIGAGFIVTPSGGVSIAKAFQITTANDAEERDPAAYELYGTNDEILSKENSSGTDEEWTWISSGSITLPNERFTAGEIVAFENQQPYRSYKVIFTELKDASAGMFQLSEFQLLGSFHQEGAPSVYVSSQWSAVEGDTVYLRCYANGSMPLIYQWYKDGVQIERAIEDILVLENVLQGDSGIYTVRVENEDGEVESDPIYLEVGSQEVEPPQLSWSIEEGLLILYYEGILLESEDLLQWNAVEEAAGSTYQIELNQGGSRYYRVVRP